MAEGPTEAPEGRPGLALSAAGVKPGHHQGRLVTGVARCAARLVRVKTGIRSSLNLALILESSTRACFLMGGPNSLSAFPGECRVPQRQPRPVFDLTSTRTTRASYCMLKPYVSPGAAAASTGSRRPARAILPRTARLVLTPSHPTPPWAPSIITFLQGRIIGRVDSPSADVLVPTVLHTTDPTSLPVSMRPHTLNVSRIPNDAFVVYLLVVGWRLRCAPLPSCAYPFARFAVFHLVYQVRLLDGRTVRCFHRYSEIREFVTSMKTTLGKCCGTT